MIKIRFESEDEGEKIAFVHQVGRNCETSAYILNDSGREVLFMKNAEYLDMFLDECYGHDRVDARIFQSHTDINKIVERTAKSWNLREAIRESIFNHPIGETYDTTPE